jgi:hypothetical protein
LPFFPHPRHLCPENENDAGIINPENQGKKEAKGAIDLAQVRYFKEIVAKPMLGDLP